MELEDGTLSGYNGGGGGGGGVINTLTKICYSDVLKYWENLWVIPFVKYQKFGVSGQLEFLV